MGIAYYIITSTFELTVQTAIQSYTSLKCFQIMSSWHAVKSISINERAATMNLYFS